jgi:hypothetical protein
MSALAGVGDFGLKALADQTKSYRDETLQFVNGRFPQSLTVYLDGTDGNDARTGLTNDSNSTTGRVKTFGRIASLYSGKVSKLIIFVYGTLDHNAVVTLEASEVQLRVATGAVLNFKKRTLASSYGEGQNNLKLMVNHAYIYNQGTINVEAHAAPPASPTESNYFYAQGAICLVKTDYIEYEAPKNQLINVLGGTINVGNYTIFVTTGRSAGETNARALFSSPGANISTTYNVGTGAAIHDLQGNRILPRNYTPSSSTDSAMGNGELCYDSSYLYIKISGTIKKVALSAF